MKSTKDRLISEVFELMDADEAITCLIHASDKETFARMESERAKAQFVSNNELRKAIQHYREILERKISEFEIRVGIRELAGLRKQIEELTRTSDCALIPKHVIDLIFRNYSRIVPGHETFPAHVRFGIHLGKTRKRTAIFELNLIEQILHEDVCCLFNLAKEYTDNDDPNSKYSFKRVNALYRACVVASFNFVECYLNAIAFDFLIDNGKRISQKQRDFLSEYDSSLGRERFVALREKLLQYPKIILSLEHPIFTESNNADVKIFLEYAKQIRDSIVHTKPVHDEINIDSNEQIIYNLRFEDVKKIVDASTNIVRAIESALNPASIRLTWLMQKNADGYFDQKSFD